MTCSKSYMSNRGRRPSSCSDLRVLAFPLVHMVSGSAAQPGTLRDSAADVEKATRCGFSTAMSIKHSLCPLWGVDMIVKKFPEKRAELGKENSCSVFSRAGSKDGNGFLPPAARPPKPRGFPGSLCSACATWTPVGFLHRRAGRQPQPGAKGGGIKAKGEGVSKSGAAGAAGPRHVRGAAPWGPDEESERCVGCQHPRAWVLKVRGANPCSSRCSHRVSSVASLKELDVPMLSFPRSALS